MWTHIVVIPIENVCDRLEKITFKRILPKMKISIRFFHPFFNQQEAEEAARAKANRAIAREEQAAARAEAAANAAAEAAANIMDSPSDFSCHSYELYVEQEKVNFDNNKEMIRSIESMSEHKAKIFPNNHSAKVRKVSAVSFLKVFEVIWHTWHRLRNFFNHKNLILRPLVWVLKFKLS